jgi:phage protein D
MFVRNARMNGSILMLTAMTLTFTTSSALTAPSVRPLTSQIFLPAFNAAMI